MNPEQKGNVSTPRPEVSTANERGTLTRDLLGGTVAMQAAGERYIPKGEAESDTTWKRRVARSTLLNIYKRTVDYLSGQVFSRPAALTAEKDKEVLDVFQRLAENVDLQGKTLSNWARDFFEDCLNRGSGLILVDFPSIKTRKSGGKTEYQDKNGVWHTKTVMADMENDWRPYFVNISQDAVLGWRFDPNSGKLLQLRFMEQVTEEQGPWDTDDKDVDQVRVLEPGRWETWRKDESRGSRDKTWMKHKEGTTTLSVIPVIALVLGEQNGRFCAYPALEDLAHLNRRHWQATADQYDLLEWMRRPVWHGSGLGSDENGDITIFGPGSMVNSSDAGAKITSVSVSPDAVTKGQEELTQLEQQMSMFGMRLLIPKTGTVTATQNAIESSENDSTLKAWALALAACVNTALGFAGMWMDVEENAVPSVTVNTEFHLLNGMEPTEVMEAVGAGLISKRMAFDELKRRGLIPDKEDWVEAQVEILNDARQQQGPSLGAGLAAGMLRQGQE